MAAISTLSGLQGFQQGYNFVDGHIRQNEHDAQRRQAIRTAEEDRQFARERQQKQDERQVALDARQQEWRAQDVAYRDSQAAAANQRAERSHALQTEQLGIAKETSRRQQQLADLQVRDKKRAELKGLAVKRSLAMEQGVPFPLALHEDLAKEGLEIFSPYTLLDDQQRQQFLAGEQLGPVLERIGSGDVEYANSPEALEAINAAYGSRIKRGLGEFVAPMGGKVVDKRIAGFRTGPNQTVVPELEVTLDNGKTYKSTITGNRSSDPDDPVELNDLGTLLDDAMGRYQLSQLAKDDEFVAKVGAMRRSLTSADQASDMSATGKTIRDLEAFGVPREEAIQLATNAKTNPQAAKLDIYKAVKKADVTGRMSEEEVAQRVETAYSQLVGGQTSQQGAAPSGAGGLVSQALSRAAPSPSNPQAARTANSPSANVSAPQPAAVEAPRDPQQRQVGEVYQTPRGPLRWMGNGWTRVEGQ